MAKRLTPNEAERRNLEEALANLQAFVEQTADRRDFEWISGVNGDAFADPPNLNVGDLRTLFCFAKFRREDEGCASDGGHNEREGVISIRSSKGSEAGQVTQ
jgi:hypothetical protein